MSAPRQVESIPTVTAPVEIPEAKPAGWFPANMIVATVAGLIALTAFVVGLVLS